MNKIIIIFVLFMFGLPSYCGCEDWKNGNYPEQLLKEYSRNYLNEYCSAPKNEQTDDIINQYGQYIDIQVKPGDVGYLNSKYDPDTILFPFRGTTVREYNEAMRKQGFNSPVERKEYFERQAKTKKYY